MQVFRFVENDMMLKRIIIADDHMLFVEALRSLLAPHYEIVGTVSDGRALLAMAPKLKPDIVLIDVAMPLLNGLEASRQLRAILPGIKIIFITQNPDVDLASDAMRQGASGYLLKQSSGSELFTAIKSALRGKTFVSPVIARSMEKAFIQDPHRQCVDKSLTPRQREVVQLLAEGKSMKEAANILNVTPRTISFHKYCVMANWGLGSTAELVQFAIKNHLSVS